MENDEKKISKFGQMPKKAISWRAIFGGLVTVFSIMLLLNLIGIAIGFGAIDPAEEQNALSGVGTGAIIWWILSNILALFVGARLASRAGVSFTDKGGIMQGFLTWALYCLLSCLLVFTAVGKVISGVGNAISFAALQASEVMVNEHTQDDGNDFEISDISWQEARAEFYALLEDTEKKALDPDRLESKAEDVAETAENQAVDAAKNPAALEEEVNKVFEKAEEEFSQSLEALDREALVNILVNRSDLSEQEARKTVNNYVDTYKGVKSEAKAFLNNAQKELAEKAEAAAEAASQAALYLSITLILGIIVAAFGGLTGVRSLRNEYRDQLNDKY
ncbi:hypothetical protein [Psychroflexus sediminis]|uniref:Uncharacterized protein n=1 Tax=Psychroflexus sediminis TaxID=470826 RepID=A0A1G7UR47_9FLAO|nr:hypothetical protein [Psychroflexus sediminis]SDG49818.1 hypothetical protein SAMN04488027_102224 [Psychroflexus sediminis]